jgi:hypothetical protein
MAKPAGLTILLAGCLLLQLPVTAQTTDFDLNAYVQYLQTHRDMSPEELLAVYPAGIFQEESPSVWGDALYARRIDSVYGLTGFEKQLIEKHGFAVSERLRQNSFVRQFLDAWENDLPIFISTDAILHAFHFHYVRTLAKVEKGVLKVQLMDLLASLHGSLPGLAPEYAGSPGMDQMFRDVDLYLTVPRRLLGETVQPLYAENGGAVDTLIQMIMAEEVGTYNFFSSVCRIIDFSQFKPRGHYTEPGWGNTDPPLEGYFRAMMWLGRMEIYLLAPESDGVGCPTPPPEDIRRQTIDAALLLELMDHANAWPKYREMEDVLRFFVGDQDNVTPENLQSLLQTLSISEAGQLLDTLVLHRFQDSLAAQPWAPQKILSQILYRDPLSPEQLEPASAFMLFGQRFVIDSYVTGSVVFDKIEFNGSPVCRLFPSTLDILFALGNDAAGQLLVPELEQYHYSTNLAALRYLIDSYGDEFWQSSIYTMWLKAIRAANPPAERTDLPGFMQTAAWWQEKMNTQLSSWAELRHDHLLYAKQSYTGAAVCSYPEAYVEPIPEVFESLEDLGRVAHTRFQGLAFSDQGLKSEILSYFKLLEGVTDTLGQVAQKELDGVPLSADERRMLQSLIYDMGICAPTVEGWYIRLLYGGWAIGDPEGDYSDYLVADYHTTPTDCGGAAMGWISHAGTGDVDMAILVAGVPGGQSVAFVGPVMSYHQYRTTNFLRLTDQEWEATYMQRSSRPNWVNLYLANATGGSRGGGGRLVTDVSGPGGPGSEVPVEHLIAQNYPNPFNPSTIISFAIPPLVTGSVTEVVVYDLNGQVVKTLLRRELPSGNYMTRWDATNDAGRRVSSGVYLYRVRAGTQQVVGKMTLLK